MNLMDTNQSPVAKMIKPAVLALVALALGIVWDVFFLGHAFGIVVPLFAVILFGVIAVLDRNTHRHLSWFEITLAGLIMVFSLFFAIRASIFLIGLNVVAMTYLFLMLVASMYGAKIRRFKIWDFVGFPIVDVLAGVFDRMSILKALKRRTGVSSRVIRGVVLGLVTVVVFGGLFIAADEVVRELLARALHIEDIMDLLDDLIVIVIMSFVFLVGLAPAFWKRPEAREIKPMRQKKDYGVEAAIALGAANLVFVAFLAIQAVYLFGGEASFESLGLTYAVYARRGFGQLLVVALIVVAITWTMRMIKSEKHEITNKVLNGSLMVLTLGVLWSSWTRLSLYENAFGFTSDRLMSHYSLIVIAVVLGIMFLGLITKIRNNTILHSVVFTFAIALIGLNLLNPDAFIAKHNIERGDEGVGIDYYTLLKLSDDAMPILAEHLQSDAYVLTVEETRDLQSQRNELDARLKVLHENSNVARRDHGVESTEFEAASAEVSTAVAEKRVVDIALDRGRRYDNWIKNYEYDDSWQAWNLSRSRARLLHEGLVD